MDAKTIFITGAASGIGRETALLFARNQWLVGLFDVNEKGLEELSGQIGQDHCCYQVMDVGDYESVRRAVDFFAQKTNNRLDVLFNNAGIMRMGLFENIPYAEQLKTIQVNVVGVLNGIFAALELLKKTPGAHIISMCSASALYGVPELATYSATKFFVRGLTEALNIELDRLGIVVTDLMPLYVDTPMVSSQTHRAGTLNYFGVKLSPAQIAQVVWKAAHGQKVHWLPTLELKLCNLLGHLLPFSQKMVMKWANRKS